MGMLPNLQGAVVKFSGLQIDPPDAWSDADLIIEVPSTGDLNTGTVTADAQTARCGDDCRAGSPHSPSTTAAPDLCGRLRHKCDDLKAKRLGLGQKTASWRHEAVKLNGATMKDSGGNAASLSWSGLTPRPGTQSHRRPAEHANQL